MSYLEQLPGTPSSALALNFFQLSSILVQPAPSARTARGLREPEVREPSEPEPELSPSLLRASEKPVFLRASLRLNKIYQGKDLV